MLKPLILTLAALALSIAPHSASILDSSFHPGTGAGGGLVEQVLPLPDGRVLVCGNFTSFNGRPRAYIARLNANGTVDETFHAQPSYWVRNMSRQADGKIVIGGFFTSVAGASRNRIARLNSDGSLDTTFNPGTGATDIIAAGIDGNNNAFVFWTAVQADGKILITGNFRNFNGASSVGLARLNSDGSRDTSFNVGGGLDSWGRHILVQPNGQILVSGWFQAYRGQWFNRIVRINPDGSADSSFTPFFGDKTAIYCTALLPDGKMMVSGHSLNEQGLFRRAVARLHANGTVDESFVGFTNEKTESIALQPDGKVIVGGYFTSANGVQRRMLARFFPDGSQDPSFAANIDNFIWSCALQADGKLLIGGGFNSIDGVARVGVARVETGATGGPQDFPPVLSVTGATAQSLTLSWSDSSTVRTGYDIEQRAGGAYGKIASVGSGVRSHTVTGLSPSTQYTFRLRAQNSLGTFLNSNDASGSTSAAPGGGGGGSTSAAFISSDTATRGAWQGIYGGEGYNVIGHTAVTPGYVTVTPIGKSDWTWQWSTQDAAALQRANGSDRIAACWYSANGFSLDFRFQDALPHRTALYFLDWDKLGRVQVVQVTDAATGALLDSRTVSSFGTGVYLMWEFKGNVRVSVVPQSGNAVVGGIFFGAAGGGGGSTGGSTGGTTPTAASPTISPNGGSFTTPQSVTLASGTSGAQIRYTLDGSEPSSSSSLYSAPFTLNSSATVRAKTFAAGHSPSATVSASFTITISSGGGGGGAFRFVGTDNSTSGNWRGVYGSTGYNIMGRGQSYPAGAQVSPSGNQQWTWNYTTADTRALQTPDGSARTASCWYLNGAFEIGLNFTDGATHRVSIYLCDWDNAGRAQTVELIDAGTGSVLHSQTVSGFGQGRYLTWDLKGNVKLRVTRVSGPNAVVNGLFFDPAPAQL